MASRRGNLHRIVRVALGPAAIFPGASVVAPMAVCRRRRLSDHLWARAATNVSSASSPGALRGPTFQHILHLIATTPISIHSLPPTGARLLTAVPASKAELPAPPPASSDMKDAPMKRRLLFELGIALLITLASYPARATTFDTNHTPGAETSPSVNTASAVAHWSVQPYCLISGDNYAAVRITDLAGHLIKSLISWPYWAKVDFIPNFVISLDTALNNYAGRDDYKIISIDSDSPGQGNEGGQFIRSNSLPYTIQPHGGSRPAMIAMTWANSPGHFGQRERPFDYCGAAMKKISLWDEGISADQRITACTDDFPLNDISLPIDSSQSLACPGAPLLLISGLVGLAFYRKRQPTPKAQSRLPVP